MTALAVLFGGLYQTLTAQATPEYVYGARSGAGTCQTGSVTAVPTGGRPGYTYSWAKVSGDTFTIAAASSATTNFSISVGINEEKSAVYRCTVTSNDGQVATCDVAITALEVSYF